MKAILYSLIAIGYLTASAQHPKQQPNEKIRALSFLLGDWVGAGWIQHPGQPRAEFKGTEKVAFVAGENALSIQGRHFSNDERTNQETLIHDAFAVVSWDKDHYQFQSWLGSGHRGDFTGQLKNESFVWGYENQWQGKVRYTIRINDAGEWSEIGERSDDGNQWTQFFSMTLKKKP